MMIRSALIALLALLLTSCSESPFSVANEDLLIRAEGGTIQLTNRTADPLYFHIVSYEASPLIDIWPCSDPAQCTAIAPGQQLEVPYTDIIEYRTGAREAVLSWWFLEPAGEHYQVVRMRSQVLKL